MFVCLCSIETKDLGWDVRMATDADDLIGKSEPQLASCLGVEHLCFTGRYEEMRVFTEELMHVSEKTHRGIGVIIITGTGGIGKTKLLRAMKAKAAMMKFR